ncbi:MAG: J domain-containing protein [Filomicrobium sp.]
MFERNRIDNASRTRENTIHVELELDDGRIAKGCVFLVSTRQLYDEMNDNGGFLDFQSYEGPRELIAKSTLRTIRPTKVPAAKPLPTASANPNEFDPYKILGLPRGAAMEAAREAYHRLARRYHPDRFNGADLPDEISDYIQAMSRRLNAAYAALDKPLKAKREINRAKTEPIYQRGG